MNWRIGKVFLAAAYVVGDTLVFPHQGHAQGGNASPMDVLVHMDVRVATVADRLLAANHALCRDVMPLTGMILHSADQYRDHDAGQWFGNGDVAVLAVVPGSAAVAAGIAEGDALVSVQDQDIATLPAEAGAPLRNTAFAVLAQIAPGEPIRLLMRRDGHLRPVDIAAAAGCRALVEVLTARSRIAQTDGRTIQISFALAAGLDDNGLAVIIAHELAHVVLEHRRRLEEAGVQRGLLGEFGRNRRLARQMESEADRLSAHLLANAGFDPGIAPDFWRSDAGERTGGGPLRRGAYMATSARADVIAQEIAAHISGRSAPYLATHLLSLRDTLE